MTAAPSQGSQTNPNHRDPKGHLMLLIGSDFLVNPDQLENVDFISATPVQTSGTAGQADTTYCARVVIYHSGRKHDMPFEGSTAEEADKAARKVFDKIHSQSDLLSGKDAIKNVAKHL